MMKRLRLAIAAIGFLAGGLAVGRAASMAGATNEILPVVLDYGGRHEPSSANYKIINSICESGKKDLSSSNYFLQPGAVNTLLWPERMVDFTVSQGVETGKIRLNWTAPKADGDAGAAWSYDIRYAMTAGDAPSISETKFLAANSITDFVPIPAPSAPGTAEQLDVSGLQCGSVYYFAVKAKASWHGWSYLSPGGSATPPKDWGAVLGSHSVDLNEVNVGSELVVPVGITVTNSGYCPATFAIKAAPVTPGTPWTLESAPGTDAFTVHAAFNSTQPDGGAFLDTDKLTTIAEPSTLNKFAMDQTGINVAGGDSRTLWLKIGMPLITGTIDSQEIRVTVYGAEP